MVWSSASDLYGIPYCLKLACFALSVLPEVKAIKEKREDISLTFLTGVSCLEVLGLGNMKPNRLDLPDYSSLCV